MEESGKIFMAAFVGPVFGCAVEAFVLNREACATSDEELDCLSMTVDSSPVQSGGAEYTLRIDRCTVVQ